MLVDNRKQLVGLLTDNPAITLEEGAQVTESASLPIGSSALCSRRKMLNVGLIGLGPEWEHRYWPRNRKITCAIAYG